MNNNSATPEEAAEITARWREDIETVRQRLVGNLIERGVDTSRFAWLSSTESESVIQHWIDLGAQRYGRLALNPPPDSNAHRGEFQDGVLPSWLDKTPRTVFVQFFRPSSGRLMARCDSTFAIDNHVAFARADGDGFGAMTQDLEGVLLVNVEEYLGDSTLEIDAWGRFVRDDRE
jgi:hypothetical protein